MAIEPVDDPPEARALAERVFRRRTPVGGGGFVDGARTLMRPPEVGAIAIYNLALEHLVERAFDRAVLTAWRYVQLRPGANSGEIAEIRAGGEPELGTFASGRLAGRMGDAAAAAQEMLGVAPDTYLPRVLRLPEIHMEALWVHAPEEAVQDRFFGLPSSQRELIDAAFLETAIARARDYLEKVRARSADRGGAPA